MAPRDALIGNRYRLVRELGSGGMSMVWEARDERLGRPVAVKQLRLEPGLGEDDARIAAERAMREARIHARLQHPSAIAIFDVVEHDGRPCLVLELVSARTLADELRERPTHTLEPARMVDIGSQVAAALAAAHTLGIVHRDIKPSNILLGADGRARVTDFGISRAVGDGTLTMTGMISGTPAYLAPEVALGQQSTAASDVFSLGATLYAALEGDPPFGSDSNAIALLHRVAQGTVTTPRRAGALTPLLNGMLARHPEARPQMTEVAAVLTGFRGVNSSSLLPGGATVSTVTVPPPTGAYPTHRVEPEGAAGAIAGPGVASITTGSGSPHAATLPSAGGPPTRAHRGRRRGLITAAVTMAMLVLAIAVTGQFWPFVPRPTANLTVSAKSSPSGLPESPGDEARDSPRTERSRAGDPATTEATTTRTSSQPTKSRQPAATSEQSAEPSVTRSGGGNSKSGSSTRKSKSSKNGNSANGTGKSSNGKRSKGEGGGKANNGNGKGNNGNGKGGKDG